MATFLDRDSTTGRVTQIVPIIAGGTAGEGNKIPQTDSTGRLSPTIMPVGVVADTFEGTAGEALNAGDVVYLTPTGEVMKASANVGGGDVQGFVLSSFSNGATNALVYFEGRNTSLSGLTPGTRYYLSDSTAGAVTSTPVSGTGKRHQYVGTAISATTLNFEPEQPITLA